MPPKADPSLPSFLLASPPPAAAPSQARLQALYASTSAQRLTNPTGYTANVTWWADVFQESLRSGWIGGKDGDRLVLKVDEEFVGKFDWDGRRPKGLGGVVERDSTTAPPKLHPLPAFLSSPTPLHAPASLTRRLVARPLYWAFSQLNPFGGEKEVKEEALWKAYGKGKEYVHVPLVESAAAKFVAHFESSPLLSYTDSLFDVDTFRRAFGQICLPDSSAASSKDAGKKEEEEQGRLSKKDVLVLVKWLMRDMGVIVSDGTVIKVLQPDETVSENPITEVDRGVVSVLNALEKVEAQITSIEQQINRCQAKAKAHLAASQRPLAISQLRSKKALDEILHRRVGVSEQLRGVVRSIDEAQNDVDVMSAYETSTSSLRTILANPLLSPDRVERTTEDLAEALASQREVDDAIRIGGAVAVGAAGASEIDEDELEAELAGLVEEEQSKKEQAEAARRKEKEEREKVSAPTKETRPSEPTKQDRPIESPIPASTGQTAPPVQATQPKNAAEDEWAKRYDAAQAREREERARADVERLKREEKRVAAVSE